MGEQLPHAAIVFDKFHIIANYHEVIDRVRRRSYHKASGEQRAFIKGQRYNLFRRPENVKGEGKAALASLLEANVDLNTVYLLKDALLLVSLAAGITTLPIVTGVTEHPAPQDIRVMSGSCVVLTMRCAGRQASCNLTPPRLPMRSAGQWAMQTAANWRSWLASDPQ